MKTVASKNILYLFTVSFFIIAGGIILLLFSKEEVTLFVNAHYSRWADLLILSFNQVGTIWFNTTLVVILFIWKGWKTALQAAACFLATVLVIFIFKHVLFPGIPRPTLYFEGKEILRLVEGVTMLKTESFPSGHTAAAFSIATVLAFILPHKKYHWILAIFAALVGFGRIYLSQHFINDVYAGMIIGMVVTFLTYILMNKILTNQGFINQ